MKHEHLTADDFGRILDAQLDDAADRAARGHLEICSECWAAWNAARWHRAEGTVDLAELREFMGSRMLEGVDSSWRLAEEWHRAHPMTEQEITHFYERTEWYLYNLIIWHASGQRPRYASYGLELLPQLGCQSICDYGCGVGTDGLVFAERGYKVLFVDINVHLLRFATFRLNKRGLHGWVGTPADLLKETATWDAVWSMDVIEHLRHPIRILEPILKRSDSFIYDTEHSGASGGRHPFHFQHSPRDLGDGLQALGLTYAGEKMHLKLWMREGGRLAWPT